MIGLALLLLYAAALIVAVLTAAAVWSMLHPRRRTLAVALAQGLPTDPADAGLRGDAVRFTFPDGVESPGWVLEGNPDAAVDLVITHGWSNSRFASLVKAELLAPLFRRIAVYDMRGQGEAGGYCTMGGREPADLVAVVEQLRDGYPEGQGVVLLGSSMGAGVSIAAGAMAAAGDSGGVAGVVAEGVYRHAMDPLPVRLRERGMPAQPMAWLAGLVMPIWTGSRAEHDRAAHASRLRRPLLGLHAEDDPITPLAGARPVLDAAADATLVTFDHDAHGGLASDHAQRYREAVEQWLAAMPTPRETPSA